MIQAESGELSSLQTSILFKDNPQPNYTLCAPMVQAMLTPVPIELNPARAPQVHQALSEFRAMGFELEPFGPATDDRVHHQYRRAGL